MSEPVSTYIHHLPPIFQESQFIDGFLLAFEKLLTQAAPTDGWDALETQINDTAFYLRPLANDGTNKSAPAPFLPWLASWVALTLRDDWPDPTRRRFLREIVPLYRLRGTKAGMKRMLEIYLGDNVPITIYDRQKTGEFNFAPPAYFFQVRIDINTKDTTTIRRIQQIAQAIIEQEKPAHTFYGLQIRIPTMRLLSEGLAEKLKEDQLILGNNTLLGTQQA